MSLIGWFKNRIKNRCDWFCVAYPSYKIEGSKQKDGHLDITITVYGNKTLVTLDREAALKLSEWFGRTYPYRSNNVIPISTRKFSVLTTSGDTGRNDSSPRGELE